MQLKDVMTSEVFCAKPSDKISEVAAMMHRHNVGFVPVCEGDRLVGVITDRDIAIECVDAQVNPQQAEVRQFMTAQPISAPPNMDVREACELIAREQVRRLPVVEAGRLMGLASLGDIAVHFADDKLIADTLRRISTPVRSLKAVATSE